MTELLDVEMWLVIGAAAFVALAALSIRLGWRRGKEMGDR
jgi:hypothetical protein